jgi:hypothetical protein
LAGAILRSILEGHDLVKLFFEYHGSVKGEMSKIYCHVFTVVFSPRKEVQDERHKEKEKEKGKRSKTIPTQTKEFQKNQYNWICRFAGLWMN